MAEQRPAWDPRTDPKYQALVEDVRDIVRHWLDRHQEISRSKLALDAGISPQTIARLVETDVRKQSMAPLLPTLFKVLFAIDIQLRVHASKEAAAWHKKHPNENVKRRGNTDYDVFLGEVRQAIWCWIGLNLHDTYRAAMEAGVSPRTVARLLYGPEPTRSPRFSTVSRLFAAAGASIWIETDGKKPRKLGTRTRRRKKRT